MSYGYGGGRSGGFGGRRNDNFGGGGGGRRDQFRPKPVEVGKEYDVEITEISRRGDGIAKIEGFVIFVSGAQAGQKLKIKVTNVGPRFADAEIASGSSTQESTSESSSVEESASASSSVEESASESSSVEESASASSSVEESASASSSVEESSVEPDSKPTEEQSS